MKIQIKFELQIKSLFLMATGVKLKPHGEDTDATIKPWIKRDLKSLEAAK